MEPLILIIIIPVVIASTLIIDRIVRKMKQNAAHSRDDIETYSAFTTSRYRQAADLAITEVIRARAKHGPKDYHGQHHAYAILLEEVDEAWDEIKRDNPEAARKEMIQVAAVALRFIAEV